ncbi:unnamed protein product [Rotaria magnacalcarata]|uniref:WD repeat-containing protein 91 n=2 Tax=Rotaria magnacalcarata TaxID=392030 RepID=A0A814NCF3_9BILA|nr:unnamed protein product [Rotaria magnacalcarata]CAF1543443.1 unnamed protein product [Rotaria magnacalcarata]CAF2044487.1 unnamed protein product [Rotaria magnacalcarata]CAF3998912.1 unnamed protein product [Rotaria magnacalcarata]
MASSFSFVDDLIRDYLNYRGLTSTLRTFDNEIGKIPIGQFRADRIIEQLTIYIHQFDINNLIDYWTQLEQRLLSTLIIRSQHQTNVLTKTRTNLYRCYLIHAIQSSKTDKINEFFDRLAKTLQQSNEWTKDWFALPFIKNPEENPTFQLYFSKQWNDLFWISLQNFLSTAFYHMIPPKICSMEENNSQQYGNLISQQTTNLKSLLPPSGRIDPSVAPFAEVLDEIQISPSTSGTEQQRQTNPTIISKFRSNFLPNTKQLTSRTKLSLLGATQKLSVSQPSFESTTGNQILLSTDDTTIPRIPLSPMATSPVTPTRPKAATLVPDDANIDVSEEKLIHLAELKHHSSTIIDCKLNMDGTLYSTLDIQSQVKIWSTIEEFDIVTSLISRSASFQCQAFNIHEPLLYLGTSMSTIKILHTTEKRIINEAIVDKDYPRVMNMYPHPNLNRLFVSSASPSRLNTTDNIRVRSGRVSIVDLNTWSIERVLTDNDDNFATCMAVHSERELFILGFNDGKLALYDVRSNTLVHQKQQHSRMIQDIRILNDNLYSIGNDNTIIQSNLSSFDQFIQSYELPYSAVGPFPTSVSTYSNENSSPSLQRTLTSLSNANYFPMGNVFDIDPYDPDRLITCSPTNGRFYRLSISDEDPKLQFPSNVNSSNQNSEKSFPTLCVNWNKERDVCMTANTNGTIQLYRRINKPDM